MKPIDSGCNSLPANTSDDSVRRLDRALTKTPESDSDLAHIIERWANLPEPIRQAAAAWEDLPEPARQALVSAAQLALAVRQSRSNLTEQSKTSKEAP
jgi:hypothetical protein